MLRGPKKIRRSVTEAYVFQWSFPLGVNLVLKGELGGMFHPTGEHCVMFTKTKGRTEGLHPWGITSPIGNKVHPWG
jgi:hypothetical protein